MKNQYFGDINDYRKYGLLRALTSTTELNCLVAWMLTPDDGSSDGKFIKYLNEPHRWQHHDPELYQGLRALMAKADQRAVHLIENSNLLPNTRFHSRTVPENSHSRKVWLDDLIHHTRDTDLVFLDPDNGMEVKSKPYGRKHSSKFAYWHEIERIWAEGKSLLIYQHFIREKRDLFTQRMLKTLQDCTQGSQVSGFATANVFFMAALQPGHQAFSDDWSSITQQNWHGQISYIALKDAL
ncbi:MAG: hypothetical protein LAT80_14780 [Balneolaceae bacterium]|nr:hypothetical protein [Saccharospirillum sp.]MCH8550134.1 hypothetical protein [Balneolaceae bacterium]